MCSASDDGAGDGDVQQVRILKSAEEVSVDRQKAHSALMMANVSLKKQAYETAMQMASMFPNNPCWGEKLEQAACEYLTACQSDVLAPPPTDWARPQRLETPDRFLTPEPQRSKRCESDSTLTMTLLCTVLTLMTLHSTRANVWMSLTSSLRKLL